MVAAWLQLQCQSGQRQRQQWCLRWKKPHSELSSISTALLQNVADPWSSAIVIHTCKVKILLFNGSNNNKVWCCASTRRFWILCKHQDSVKPCNLTQNYPTKKAFPLNHAADNTVLPGLAGEKKGGKKDRKSKIGRKMVLLFPKGNRETLIPTPGWQTSIYRNSLGLLKSWLVKSTPFTFIFIWSHNRTGKKTQKPCCTWEQVLACPQCQSMS